MQVSEVMNKGIVSINIDETIKKAAQLMRSEDIGALPVFQDNKPVGFVTDRDIVITCVAEGQSTDDPISHAMTDEVFTINQEEDVTEASKLMQDNQISRIIVVDNEKHPVGMVSLKDFHDALDSDTSMETFNKIKNDL